MQQLLLAVQPTFLPTYENFMVGDNCHAFTAVQKLQAGRALYLWGEQGSGRSHLLQASTRHSGTLYLHPNAPPSHFALANEGIARHIAIDDIEQCSTEQQNDVFNLYQLWRETQSGSQAFSLLIAGSASPLFLENVREDLRTRLSWDVSMKLFPLSDEQKITALLQLANSLGIPIRVDSLTWLLHHYERNMGALTQFIHELDRYSLEKKKPITLPLLKEILHSINKTNGSEQLTFQGI